MAATDASAAKRGNRHNRRTIGGVRYRLPRTVLLPCALPRCRRTTHGQKMVQEAYDKHSLKILRAYTSGITLFHRKSNVNEMIQCQACCATIPPGSSQCPACGAPIPGGVRYKDRIASAVLAFFAGGLGFHRFYLGQWWGVFYLLFCCTGIPFLVAFIEFIVFLCTSQEKWDARHNNGQGGSMGGGSIAFVIVSAIMVPLVLVFTIFVVAAIAVPAYADYNKRAQISEVVIYGHTVAMAELDYFMAQGHYPARIEETGIDPAKQPKYVESVQMDTQNSTVILNLVPYLGGTSIGIVLTNTNGQLGIVCSRRDTPSKLVPAECRH